MNNVLGYIKNDTAIHRLSGTTKLIVFILLSVIVMTSYDTRFLILVMVISLLAMKIAEIHWKDVDFLVKIVAIFSLINIIAIYIFEPDYGVKLYESKTVLLGTGRYALTKEQLFYEFNVALKYFSTIPLALVFILATDPSEFSGSLNRIGLSYKISYAVALALRYIPDIQKSYFDSLERIETISQAMELRRFGKNKTRTWYKERPVGKNDIIVLILSLLIVAIGISLFFVNKGRFYNPF